MACNHLKLVSGTGRHSWINLDDISFIVACEEDGKPALKIIFRAGHQLVIDNTPHFTDPLEKYWGFKP